jgi:hypothetical protein
VIGTVDATGTADLANAVTSLIRAVDEPDQKSSHLRNAAMSAIGAIPFFGNAGFLGKSYKNAAVASKEAQRVAGVAASAPGLSRLARINAKLAAHRPGVVIGLAHSIAQLAKSIVGRKDSTVAYSSGGGGSQESYGNTTSEGDSGAPIFGEQEGGIPSVHAANFNLADSNASSGRTQFAAREQQQPTLRARARAAYDGFRGRSPASTGGSSGSSESFGGSYGNSPQLGESGGGSSGGSSGGSHSLAAQGESLGGAFVKATLAVAMLGITAHSTAKSLLAAQSGIAVYNGTMGNAAAMSEARSVARAALTGSETGGSYAALSKSSSDMSDRMRPYTSLGINAANRLLQGMIELTSVGMTIAETIFPLLEVVTYLTELLGGSGTATAAYTTAISDISTGKYAPGPTVRPR